MQVSCSYRNIYCPRCGRKVGSHDGKATNVKEINCRKCWKTIVFNPLNGAIKVKPIPKRLISSGMTFR